jgi:hypothetical protein
VECTRDCHSRCRDKQLFSFFIQFFQSAVILKGLNKNTKINKNLLKMDATVDQALIKKETLHPGNKYIELKPGTRVNKDCKDLFLV